MICIFIELYNTILSFQTAGQVTLLDLLKIKQERDLASPSEFIGNIMAAEKDRALLTMHQF